MQRQNRKIIVGVTVGILIVIVGAFTLFINSVIPRQYITTDISDYGNYVGNYDNKSVQEFVNSFFPEKLEDNFTDISYSYRAQKNDAYAFEVYLEFTIEDIDELNAFLEQYTFGITEKEFSYDSTYNEYVIADIFEPTNISQIEDAELEEIDYEKTHIRYAKIGKILYSSSEQKFIFVALGVYDGGIATTDFLCTYFERFDINPLEYSETRMR